MNYRELGKTGLEVSEIGYGAWGIGKSSWIGASDDESVKALHKSIDLGLNFIDTALAYGDGHSEKLVGQLIRDRSERIYVATKIPPKNEVWPAQSGTLATEAFPAEHVIACTEQSLKNLGLESVDVQQFHVWSDEWVDQGDWLEAVQKLKEQGKIKHFGVSINDYQPENAIKLIETGAVDTVQVIARGELHYANAGHPAPLCVHRARISAEPLPFRGSKRDPVLGIIEDAEYHGSSCELCEGDTLLLFTDGLFEVEGVDAQYYDQARLLESVSQRASLRAGELCDQVLAEIQRFAVAKGFTDDVCLVAVEIDQLLKERFAE